MWYTTRGQPLWHHLGGMVGVVAGGRADLFWLRAAGSGRPGAEGVREGANGQAEQGEGGQGEEEGAPQDGDDENMGDGAEQEAEQTDGAHAQDDGLGAEEEGAAHPAEQAGDSRYVADPEGSPQRCACMACVWGAREHACMYTRVHASL